VQLYDIVPTALALANVSEKHVHFAQSLVGYLSTDAAARAAAPPARRFVFAEASFPLSSQTMDCVWQKGIYLSSSAVERCCPHSLPTLSLGAATRDH
jgi:hypothetical protein